MAYQSVLIRVRGRSEMRVIVPPSPTAGDPVVEAVEMLKAMAEISPTDWIAEIHPTPEMTDLEIKQ